MLYLSIRALLLDHFLALKKTTRTPRVHHVSSNITYSTVVTAKLRQLYVLDV